MRYHLRPFACVGSVGLLVTSVMTLALECRPAFAQDPDNRQGAQQSQLPPLPQRPPRPAQGNAAPDRWQRPDEVNDKPVASLFETVRGNDASLEVVVGQGRLLTTKRPISEEGKSAFIAVGDPSVIDFEVLPNPQMIRVTGKRPGATDLSVTTADGETFSFQVHVVYDLRLLSAYLKQAFPESLVKVSQIRDHIILEGQARSAAQVTQIVQMVEGYLASVQPRRAGAGGAAAYQTNTPPPDPSAGNGGYANGAGAGLQSPLPSPMAGGSGRVINLLKVPGANQVMLQVRIAELNRTGLREIGADLGYADSAGNVLSTNIGGAIVNALGLLGPGGVAGAGSIANSASTTAVGIFPTGDFEIFLRALRRNTLLNILAEPNLVSMSGHEASFLAGGQFPVPVPQVSGGVANSITVEFKNFGVQLGFLPFVLDDDVIRLTVTPEVSTIDASLGTVLVVGGTPVPGLNTRRATTTVELREGQTLAIAGLLQVELDAHTDRIPGLGDLPYLGPLFSNTTHKRVEKELLVLVTPHLVSPMNHDQVPPLPGSEILDPNDWEFYLLNRIEGRTEVPFRSTTSWDCLQRKLYRLERRSVYGPAGFSECK